MPNCSDLYVDRQLNSNPPDSYCSHQFMKVQFFKALLTNNCQYDNQSYHLGFLLGGIRFFLYRYKFWNNSGLPLRRAKGENYRQAGLGQCPLWVKSGHWASPRFMSALPPKADISRATVSLVLIYTVHR